MIVTSLQLIRICVQQKNRVETIYFFARFSQVSTSIQIVVQHEICVQTLKFMWKVSILCYINFCFCLSVCLCLSDPSLCFLRFFACLPHSFVSTSFDPKDSKPRILIVPQRNLNPIHIRLKKSKLYLS